MQNPLWCLVVNTAYLKLRQGGPLGRIVFRGIERSRQFLEEPARVVLIRAHEAVADHRADLRINRPVDEHAEGLVAEGFEFFRFVEVTALVGGFVGRILVGGGWRFRRTGVGEEKRKRSENGKGSVCFQDE
jgi:hypothetical protein